MLKSYTLTASIFDAHDICTSNHNPVISYFDASLILSFTKQARVKQLKRNRHVFKLDSVSTSQW